MRPRSEEREGKREKKDELKQRAKKAQENETHFFDQVLAPGTAVIMTLESNRLTQHVVPEVAEAGSSGSFVFRTITQAVSCSAKSTRRRRP